MRQGHFDKPRRLSGQARDDEFMSVGRGVEVEERRRATVPSVRLRAGSDRRYSGRAGRQPERLPYNPEGREAESKKSSGHRITIMVRCVI